MRGCKLGSKRGPYKKKPKVNPKELGLIDWLLWIRISTNLPRTTEDLLTHKEIIDKFIKEHGE